VSEPAIAVSLKHEKPLSYIVHDRAASPNVRRFHAPSLRFEIFVLERERTFYFFWRAALSP
jgi:hypothetical protein